jgi:hypothetical protein
MRNTVALISVMVLVIDTQVLCAETYYLSPGGSDARAGTSPQNAWKTIHRVNKASLQAGDSVLMEGGGSFPGNLLVRASGTANAPITIASFGGGTATIRGGDSYGIRLLNCQFVEVRNLQLVGSGVTPLGKSTNKAIGLDIYSTVMTGKPWQSIHVDRVTVKGFREGIVFHTPLGVQGDLPRSYDHYRANGIEFFKPARGEGVVGYNDVQITNCEVGECLFSGIYGWGSARSSGKPWFIPVGNGTFTNCRIAGCVVHDIYCDPVGDPWLGTPIQLLNATGCTIERCTIRHCGQAANPKGSQGGIGGLVFLECDRCVAQFNECHHMLTTIRFDGCAFDIDGGCTNCVLQYNYSHDNEGSGFQSGPFAGCSPLGDNTIRYNISQDDAKKNTDNTGGIMTWGSQPRGQIYNNTVFAGKGLKSNPAAFRGGDGFAVRNNIFVVDHGGEILVAGRATFQNNCYWRTNGDLHLAGHADLAAWRKASGQERFDGGDVGFQIDPQFYAPGGGNSIDDAARLGTLRAYDLLPCSALVGKGLDLQRLFKITPGLCDFHGRPFQPEMKFSLGASQGLPTSSSAP